jgi:ArsR family transcriptional regulator
LIYGVHVVAVSTSLKKAASLFHALSDETRLELLDRLKAGERCVCELTDAMKAAQSRVSFHLKVLKEAGLILDRREGRWMYYSMNPEAIEDLEAVVDTLKQAAKSAVAGKQCR